MRGIGTLAAAVIATVVSATAANASNLIINGDFSGGNSGFSSGYNYVAPTPNSMYPEGLYTIASDPFSVHNLWVSIPGGNPQLIVNGSTDDQTPVWEEDGITTAKAGTYSFSADITDVCCNSNFTGTNYPSELTFQVAVNGGSWTDVSSFTTTPPDGGVQNHIVGSFASTAGGEFDIRAINGSSQASGNDFAIDNIAVAGVPEPAAWAMMLIGFFGLGAMMRSASGKRSMVTES